jgi:soluble lytic murein transglycosylase-like protein/TolA-binding protein
MSRRTWVAALCFLAACAPDSASLSLTTQPPALAATHSEGGGPVEHREMFHRALSFYDEGDLTSAEALLLQLKPVYTELADYVLRYLARIAEARSDEADALDSWRALEERFPDSVWRGEAELALGRARAAEGNWAAAAGRFAAARRDLRTGSARAVAFALGIEAARQRGDVAEARELATELRRRYPQTPQARAASDEAWADRHTVALESPTSAREEISLLLSEGEAARALELARSAQQRFRSPSELPGLLWLEARARLQSGDREAGERVLERIRATYPRDPVAAKALFQLGSLAWNRDDDATALRLFGRYTRQYPRGSQAAESLYGIARIHQEARRYSLASAQFARLAKLHPKSSLAAEARFRVGWCQYRRGDRARAAEVFKKLAEGGSADRAAAYYWRARSSGDARIYESLLRDYPESYYASLAERRLGRPEGSALAHHLAHAASVASEATCTSTDPHLERFDELRAMNLAPLARGELAAFQERRISECNDFLIRAWLDVEGFRQSVARAVEAGGCALDSPLLRFCYPLAFWGVVERESANRSLDAYLVAALIRQESLFDPDARSPANALGLMQIVPTTGERLAAESGRMGFQSERLFDPAENIALGTLYLRELLGRYDGNLSRVLAAYNAGEAAVDKWLRRYPDVQDDEFVESISYRETRAYVKRVLANRRLYRAVYAPGSAVPGDSNG